MSKPFDYFESGDRFKRPLDSGPFDLEDTDSPLSDPPYYTGPINQDFFVRALLFHYRRSRLIEDFFYKDFLKDLPQLPQGNSFYEPIFQTAKRPLRINAERELHSFDAALSTKTGATLDPTPVHAIKVQPDRTEALYRVSFAFTEGTPKEDGDQLVNLKNGQQTELQTEGTAVVAAMLSTSDHEEFTLLMQTFRVQVKAQIKAAFLKAYGQLPASDLDRLDNFYAQAPPLVLEEFPQEALAGDFLKLLRFDAARFFYDNSSSLIKILGAILVQEGGVAFLHQHLSAYPVLVKQVYQQLDDKGQHFSTGPKDVPYKTIFATLCLLISQEYRNTNPGTFTAQHRFRSTEEFRVNSEILAADSEPGKYTLVQERLVKRSEYLDPVGSVGHDALEPVKGSKEIWVKVGEPVNLEPMDLVLLTTRGPDGKLISLLVPAIFIKDEAHHREWAEFEQFLRITLDIVVLALSVYTLGTGAGALLRLVSITDAVLAGGDIAVTVGREAIRKLPGGEAFLELWDQVYTIGGMLTAFPFLGQLLKTGFLTLGKAGYGRGAHLLLEGRKSLAKMLENSLRQSHIFTRFVQESFEIVVDYRQVLQGGLRVAMTHLSLAGAYLIKYVQQGVQQWALCYKDAVLYSGSPRQIKLKIGDVFRQGKRNFGRYLRELYVSKVGSGAGIIPDYIPGTRKLSKRMFRQETENSCAAAVVRQICKDFKIYKTEKEIRQMIRTEPRGAFLDQVAPTLKELFLTKNKTRKLDVIEIKKQESMETARENLMLLSGEAKYPWYASVDGGESLHAVIVDEVAGDVVKLRDPTGINGEVGLGGLGIEGEMQIEDFLRLWSDSDFHLIYWQ